MSRFRRRLIAYLNPVKTTPDYITFVDANVEALCASNWGSGGKITYVQAAKVTTIGDVFNKNTTITSFNELQYFTGLTSWSSTYYGTMYQCTALKSVTLPKCSLTLVKDRGWGLCSSLSSFIIPEGYTSLGASCFQGCALTDVLLPSTLTSIGSTVFHQNSAALKVRILATSVPTLSGTTFGYIANGLKIYVPDDSVSAYKTAWTELASNIYAISTYTS